MKTMTACPICHRRGCIYITDYIEYAVKERLIPCPLCMGLGLIKVSLGKKLACS